MDSNSFNPSGRGEKNNKTPQHSPTPPGHPNPINSPNQAPSNSPAITTSEFSAPPVPTDHRPVTTPTSAPHHPVATPAPAAYRPVAAPASATHRPTIPSASTTQNGHIPPFRPTPSPVAHSAATAPQAPRPASRPISVNTANQAPSASPAQTQNTPTSPASALQNSNAINNANDASGTTTPENHSENTPEIPTPENSPTPSSPTDVADLGVPASTTNNKPKSHTKPLLIIGGILLILAIAAAVIFLVPFGNQTLWQKMTNPSQSTSTGNNQPKNTVTTNGYTYTKNLNLAYQPDSSFHDGLIQATTVSGSIVFLNTSGELAFELNQNYIPNGYFADGLMPIFCADSAAVATPEEAESGAAINANYMSNLKYGYVNTSGELVIPCQYSSAREFVNGYAAIAKSDDANNQSPLFGIIDTNGNLVVDYKFSDFEYADDAFTDGIFKGAVREGETVTWGCYNVSGETIKTLNDSTETCFEATTQTISTSAADIQAKLGDNYTVAPFSEGLALVTSNTSPVEYFYVDENGERVWELDSANVITTYGSNYSEGLVSFLIWIGEEPFPGIDALNADANATTGSNRLYDKCAIVFYDNTGNQVFMYKFENGVAVSK